MNKPFFQLRKPRCCGHVYIYLARYTRDHITARDFELAKPNHEIPILKKYKSDIQFPRRFNTDFRSNRHNRSLPHTSAHSLSRPYIHRLTHSTESSSSSSFVRIHTAAQQQQQRPTFPSVLSRNSTGSRASKNE